MALVWGEGAVWVEAALVGGEGAVWVEATLVGVGVRSSSSSRIFLA